MRKKDHKSFRFVIIRLGLAIILLLLIAWTIDKVWELELLAALLILATIILGFVFAWVLLVRLFGGSLKDIKWDEQNRRRRRILKDEDWDHYYDSSYLGSPLNRSPFDD